MSSPLHLVLEFARAESAGQPHGFRFAAQPYLLRTPGGGFEAAEFPWSPELLDDLRALRGVAPGPEVVHRIGAVLRDFLAGAGWAAREQAIVGAAQAGAPILVTIRSAAAELYALPWELLALKSTGQLLGGIPGLLVRYEWPETTSFPDAVPPAARRGRVLFAWSAAGGGVPASEHLAALQTALHARGFDPARDVVAHASFAAIAGALDRARREGPPIDALHLLCHGAAAGGTYGLALDDEAEPGERVVVDAGRLQQLLAPHAGMVRMVVLAACDSGNVGELGNHLGSVAQMIHRAGLRSVVASRFPLSVAGSSHLCAALYAALAAPDTSLERAFVAARDVLVRDPGQLDWASVQLYARAADGDASFPLGPAATAVAAPAAPPPRRRAAPWAALGLGAAVLAALLVWRPWSPGADPTPPAPVAAPPASSRPEGPGAVPPAAGVPVPFATTAGDVAVAPPTPTKPTVKPTVRPTPRPTAPGECPRQLRTVFDTNLPAPADGVVPPDFRVTVAASGAATYASDSADYVARLRARRSALTDRQRETYAADLPCTFKVVSRP